jgi:hypothetical protein
VRILGQLTIHCYDSEDQTVKYYLILEYIFLTGFGGFNIWSRSL